MRSLPLSRTGTALLAFVLSAVSAEAVGQTETILYSLGRKSGDHPYSPLLLDNNHAGLLYGTARQGGPKRGGTVFELRKQGNSWREQTLHDFGHGDGAQPETAVVQDATGALYGTTAFGGIHNRGIAFELTQSGGVWNETILHEFRGRSDGKLPLTNLALDPTTGTLYGTTAVGGGASFCGTVFALTNKGWTWQNKTLYDFGGGNDACEPSGVLVFDGKGHLFGTSANGPYDHGTVFELSDTGGNWTETVLYSFAGDDAGTMPTDLALDPATGNLYGVVSGVDADAVFLLSNKNGWSEETLHTFSGSDGQEPYGVTWDARAHTLYGTTAMGGANDQGTAFELVKHGGLWSFSKLHDFGSGGDGGYPFAPVIEDPATGDLYGTTEVGGADQSGTVFQLEP